MRRFTLFAKGNVDVHDSLHSCRIGGKFLWNGINEVFRAAGRDVTVRVRHETMTRSDSLLRASGTIPQALADRNLRLGSYPLDSQFSRMVFESKADAIILSAQSDIASGMTAHRTDGYFFYPSEVGTWSADDRAWLKANFETLTRLSVSDSMANFVEIVGKIRERSDAPILIYNLSPIVGHEIIHCYLGLGETLSTRIRKFNLGLIEMAEETGVSIIDVDTIVARHGADALKIDAMHLTPEGYRLVAQEVAKVLDHVGLLDSRS